MAFTAPPLTLSARSQEDLPVLIHGPDLVFAFRQIPRGVNEPDEGGQLGLATVQRAANTRHPSRN